MGRIFREVQCSPTECLLLVALADHGEDDGSKIFPTVEYLCWKTRLSERLVRQKLASWRDATVLTVMDEGRGRGRSIEYQLNVDVLERKEPFAGDRSGTARVARRPKVARGKGASRAPING
jgi:hypothetical protein